MDSPIERQNGNPPTVAEIRAWAASPAPVTLPHSGLEVTVRRMSSADLARSGHIPDALVHHVWQGLEDLGPEVEAKGYDSRLDAINTVACALLVEPRMTMTGGNDALAPSDLPFLDRLYLWQIGIGQVQLPGWARFPGGQAAVVAPASDGDDLQH